MRSLASRALFWLLTFFASLLIRLFYASYKKSFAPGGDFPQDPVIICMWHGELLMIPFFYKKFRNKNVYAVISHHKDGELISRTVAHLGINSIRGSSKKGGVKVLLEALKRLKTDDVAITPDGPRGPRHSVADGIVAMAQKSGAKIVGIRVKARSAWRFKSWDKHLLPKPFSLIEFRSTPAFSIDGLSVQEAKEKILQEMGTDDYAG